jgi:hypothetical protein
VQICGSAAWQMTEHPWSLWVGGSVHVRLRPFDILSFPTYGV